MITKEELRIVAIATEIAVDNDNVLEWDEESEYLLEEYSHKFSEDDIELACEKYANHSSTDMESKLLRKVLEYTHQ